MDDDLGDIIIAIVSMILAFGTTGERIRTDEREFLALFFVSCKHSRISQSTALRRRRWRNAAREHLDLLAIRKYFQGQIRWWTCRFVAQRRRVGVVILSRQCELSTTLKSKM